MSLIYVNFRSWLIYLSFMCLFFIFESYVSSRSWLICPFIYVHFSFVTLTSLSFSSRVYSCVWSLHFLRRKVRATHVKTSRSTSLHIPKVTHMSHERWMRKRMWTELVLFSWHVNVKSSPTSHILMLHSWLICMRRELVLFSWHVNVKRNRSPPSHFLMHRSWLIWVTNCEEESYFSWHVTGGPIDFKRKCRNPTVGCGVLESPNLTNSTDLSWIPQ